VQKVVRLVESRKPPAMSTTPLTAME
jgi:hypothetical protein